VYGPGWDGGGQFDHGETEDHLIRVEPASTLGEYGDAPEEAPAYPAAGVVGQFPTCRTLGASGFVFHAASGALFLGPTVDYETDGDAGTCAWPDYDEDECGPMAGGDAGLIEPGAFTIDPGLNIVPCGANTRPLGGVCQTAAIGPDLDIDIQNGIGQDAYLNLLVDWDNSGTWGGTSTCALFGTTDEHLLQNVVVPAGFSGPLSLLVNPSFVVPTGPGHVWARFTLSDTAVPASWDGSGTFGDGETEDYLLSIASTSGAPESAPPAPQGLRLGPARPNPSRDEAVVHFVLPAADAPRLTIVDVAGRRVVVAEPGELPAGAHTWRWDGRDSGGRRAPAGVYVVRLESSGQIRTLKLLRQP
jgi:hypothetical protein